MFYFKVPKRLGDKMLLVRCSSFLNLLLLLWVTFAAFKSEKVRD